MRITLDAEGAIQRTMPLLEKGLDEGVITEEEAGELLTEAVLRTLKEED